MVTLILCIGNREGGDDGIGPYIAQRLKAESPQDIILDSGIAPENYTGVIKRYKPDRLILIDAAEMNISPGEIRVIPPEKLGTMHISTHGIPLSVFIRYLEKEVSHIIFIGIQPQIMLRISYRRKKRLPRPFVSRWKDWNSLWSKFYPPVPPIGKWIPWRLANGLMK